MNLIKNLNFACEAVHLDFFINFSKKLGGSSDSMGNEKRYWDEIRVLESSPTAARTQRPRVRIPLKSLKPQNLFFSGNGSYARGGGGGGGRRL